MRLKCHSKLISYRQAASSTLHPAVVEEVAQIILGCGFGSLGLEFRV